MLPAEFVTVRAASFDAVSATGGNATIEALEPGPASARGIGITEGDEDF